MDGPLFRKKTFNYQTVMLDELRRKYSSAAEHQPLNDVLERIGWLEAITQSAPE